MENYHSHTEFCDGRASMSEMAAAASLVGFDVWGTSPHSPVCCDSCANMKAESLLSYLEESARLKSLYEGKMKILTGMEIDYISPEFGPHIEYFRTLPLDFRIGSVHFVRTREGKSVDVDGPVERFLKYLDSEYDGDIRYVVETYFAMQIEMLKFGGFNVIGHLDKIGDNASAAFHNLEDQLWYADYVENVISEAVEKDVVIEINTKKYQTSGRFFPSERWWHLLKKYGSRIVLSTDAHYPDKVDAGYHEAYALLEKAGLIHNLVLL